MILGVRKQEVVVSCPPSVNVAQALTDSFQAMSTLSRLLRDSLRWPLSKQTSPLGPMACCRGRGIFALGSFPPRVKAPPFVYFSRPSTQTSVITISCFSRMSFGPKPKMHFWTIFIHWIVSASLRKYECIHLWICVIMSTLLLLNGLKQVLYRHQKCSDLIRRNIWKVWGCVLLASAL